ncbi:MAG: hypothetical protein IJY12_03345 [Clostridia bacterium]|nr:hypothetical protein [Clostridia bacterium]
MEKIDPTVKKETVYIAAWVAVFSALTQAVFLIIGHWDYTVLTGNLLGALAATLNFFLMGVSVQRALAKEAEKDAKQVLRLSRTLRMLFLFVVAVIGVTVPCFHYVATLIPLLFPRIAIAFRPLFDKKINNKEESDHEG